MKTSTLTATAFVAALALTACTENGPENMTGVVTEVVALATAEAGDPAVYAPPGWPLQIGDTLGYEFLHELTRQRFYSSRVGHAMHVVGDTIYEAKWRLPTSPHGTLVYRGHYPTRPQPSYLRDRIEGSLPERFYGKVLYEDRERPEPRLRHPEGQEVKLVPPSSIS